MLYGFLLGVHLVVCVSLVLVVLLQSGKGGGLAGAFGGAGGAGQTLFGGRGAATFLSKATTVLGIAFMTTSLVLALMAGGRSAPRSVIRTGGAPVGNAPPPVTTEPIQLPGAADVGIPPAGETETSQPAGLELPGAPSQSEEGSDDAAPGNGATGNDETGKNPD